VCHGGPAGPIGSVCTVTWPRTRMAHQLQVDGGSAAFRFCVGARAATDSPPFPSPPHAPTPLAQVFTRKAL
jgi:hypothetical protein